MPPASSDEQAGNFHGASIDVTPGNHDQNRKDRDSRVPDADRSGRAPAESCERRSSVSVQELPTFGRTDFQVGGMVGQGSFATVHKARHIGSGRSVVLKVVRPESELDFGTGPNGSTPAVCYRDVLRAMKKEVSLMMSLGTTKHVVQVLGTAEDCRVLVMERAVSDLYTIIKQQGLRLPLGHAKLWAGHMIAAIDFIHSMGVVHQDIKSSNVIVFPDRTAKLCDFGLAKKGQDIMVVDRELITLWYRAPELLMGDDTYTPKVDEWGVGCVLLEMMIGVPPFKGKPECVCSCSQITHRNFNSDQLMKIFLCLGSPEKKSTLSCSNHFGRWPTFPRKLESTLRRVITADRLVHLSGAAATDHEVLQAYEHWSATISAMLALTPGKRVTAAHALQLPLFAGHSEGLPSSPTHVGTPKNSPTGELLSGASPQSHSASGRDSLPTAQPHHRLSPAQGRHGSNKLPTRPTHNTRRSSLDAAAGRGIEEAARARGPYHGRGHAAGAAKSFDMAGEEEMAGGKPESGASHYVPTDTLQPRSNTTSGNILTSIGRRVDAFIRRGSSSGGSEDTRMKLAANQQRRNSITDGTVKPLGGPGVKFTADSKFKRHLNSPTLAVRRGSSSGTGTNPTRADLTG